MDSVILFCPHCCNTASQTKLHAEPCKAEYYGIQDGEKDTLDGHNTIVRCETCKEILIYQSIEVFEENDDTVYGNLVYPTVITNSKGIPASIKTIYNDASRVKNISPDAYAVLARKTLEEICKEQGVVEESLEKSLKKLVEAEKIPKNLIEACNIVRLVGNQGAHAGNIKVNMLHVWAIDSFIKVILEYMYVAPNQITEFKERYKDFIK